MLESPRHELEVRLEDPHRSFGTAVNLYARVQKESQGGDIVATEEIWRDPGVRSVLAGRKHLHEAVNCTLRGLTGERTVYRIFPQGKT